MALVNENESEKVTSCFYEESDCDFVNNFLNDFVVGYIYHNCYDKK